jgi:hypothetical protein
MLEEPQLYFMLKKDGWYRRETNEIFLGPQAEIVRALAKTVPRVIKGVMSEDETLAVTASGLSVARRLRYLKMNTFFRPTVDVSERVSLVPVWKQGKPAATQMNLVWTPPSTMGLYLVLYWEVGTAGSINSVEPVPYLVAASVNKRTYLLPIPNLYDDGKICLGRDETSRAQTFRTLGGLGAQLDAATKILQETTWNVDLLRNVSGHTQDMFRFDADGKQMPVPNDWTEHCTLINQSTYEFLGGIEIA